MVFSIKRNNQKRQRRNVCLEFGASPLKINRLCSPILQVERSIANSYAETFFILKPGLSTLRFSSEFGLFCGVAFFYDLRVAYFWGYFILKLLGFWACFLQISLLQIAFFKFFCHLCCFKVLQKAIQARFCVKLLILDMFFGFASLLCF